jgi:hypothetical protein
MKPANAKTVPEEEEAVAVPVAAVMAEAVVVTAVVEEEAVTVVEAVAMAAEVEAAVAEIGAIAEETGTVVAAETDNAGKPQRTFHTGPARFLRRACSFCEVSFHP